MFTYIYTTYTETRLATQNEISNMINVVKCLPINNLGFFGETRLYNNGLPTKKEAVDCKTKVYKKCDGNSFEVGCFVLGIFKRTSLYD